MIGEVMVAFLCRLCGFWFLYDEGSGADRR